MALFPYPDGCTGWFLWKLMPWEMSRSQYLETFDRRNLLASKEWDIKAAKAAAKIMLPDLNGRFVIILGTQVRTALGLAPMEPLLFTTARFPFGNAGSSVAFDCLALPHPSGRNFWYRKKENVEATKRCLELAIETASLQCEV